MSNIDVGARTIEVNRVEYVVRGLGFIESLSDIEQAVVKVKDNVPLTIKDVATVTLGPAIRRGALDKSGAEAVGGVVVVRYGQNPLATIKNVKKKMEELAPGSAYQGRGRLVWHKSRADQELCRRPWVRSFRRDGPKLDQEAWLGWLRNNPASDWPEWITTSHVTIVPFYDRSGLDLRDAWHAQRSVGGGDPGDDHRGDRHGGSPAKLVAHQLALAACGPDDLHRDEGVRVDANIVALSGIAIAIGTMVDMGVVLCENILKHLDDASPDENRLEVIYQAATEVGSAVLTAVATTVVSFLPVFTMIGAEGKLFKPLAFTKTFALIASVIVALTIIPPVAHVLIAGRVSSKRLKQASLIGLVLLGLAILFFVKWWVGLIVICFGVYHLASEWIPPGCGSSVPG